jgi:hypothetical protein
MQFYVLLSYGSFVLILNVQEQEKRAKEAELIFNLKEGSSIRMGIIRNDRILNGISPQISACAPDSNYNMRDCASETATNQSELHVARESLTATRKRCEDLDRALNQVDSSAV